MQNGAETHSTYICLPPRLLSHGSFYLLRLFLPSPSQSPDAASGSVPPCLSLPPLLVPALAPLLPFSALGLCSLSLCLQLLGLCLPGDIAEVLEFGALPVLGSLRSPGRAEAWTQHPTPTPVLSPGVSP